MMSLFSSDLAIDLGTANTCVYARGKGIVVNEPSIVAINKVNGRVEAVGKDAKDMLGRTPGNIVAIKPMKDGVIADFEVTEDADVFHQEGAQPERLGASSDRDRRPSEITQVEKRAVRAISAYRARGERVHLVEEAMAAAIARACSITEPSGNMIVDIGGGTATSPSSRWRARLQQGQSEWPATKWTRPSFSASRRPTTCSSASERPSRSRSRSARRSRSKNA
jgi:rod shape-determining protein MreB